MSTIVSKVLADVGDCVRRGWTPYEASIDELRAVAERRMAQQLPCDQTRKELQQDDNSDESASSS